MENQPRPLALYGLIFCLIILAGGGLIGGAAFLLDPTGGLLKLSRDILRDLPINDFILPGFLLFTIMGLFPLFLVYALWKQPHWPFMNRLIGPHPLHWSWRFSLGLAILLIIWIDVEFLLFGYQAPIQIVMGILGFVMIGLLLLRRLRDHLSIRNIE